MYTTLTIALALLSIPLLTTVQAQLPPPPNPGMQLVPITPQPQTPILPFQQQQSDTVVPGGGGGPGLPPNSLCMKADPANYDNFGNVRDRTYSLTDGQTSPNGKWFDQFNGFGTAGTTPQGGIQNGNCYLFEQPKVSTAPGETHANLITSTTSAADFHSILQMNTFEQLRQGSPPNTWEAAWIFFHWTDNAHQYYFVLKTNGVELGKKDGGGQIFLVTNNAPTLQLGHWYTVDLTVTGSASSQPHVVIKLDGQTVIDYTDTPNNPAGIPPVSQQLAGPGKLGLYNEDAHVGFDNVNLS